MNTKLLHRLTVVVCMLISIGCSQQPVQTRPDLLPCEGMWLPNALPRERLQKQFGFEPTTAWADHLRLASVHIGASGAFVSPDGLVLTNHHVAAGGLQNISRPGKDYIADGFLARTQAEEVQLPGEELDVLVSMENVTDRVNHAVDPKIPPDQAVKARHAVFADIERESKEKTGFQSSVVTLYGGALYHLYRYKRYSDIRVVFAPEASTAFFGGDPDNFEYPRYCLDIALLRAYENGKPAHVENYLKLSERGVGDGEAVFVSGHPARTDRLLPVSVLTTMRDVTLPLRIESMESYEHAVLEYAAKSDEARRQAQEDIFGIQNGLKATRPRLTALKSGIIEQKQMQEDALRARLRQRSDLHKYDIAWDQIAAAEKARARLHLRHMLLEESRGFSSDLFWQARQLVRLAAEDAKPDGQRLPEYTQSKRESLEHDLFAEYPIYPDLEIAKLTASLRFVRDKLGDVPIVRKVLRGEDPATRARELVEGSKLASVAERKRIRAGGPNAIAESTDSMIELARLVDPESRAVRLAYEAEVNEPETRAMGNINLARFALLGTGDYPDATATLRLAFGVVKGYEQDGEPIAPWTTLAGAFDHEREHGAKEPFKLPKTWHDARTNLEAQTPLNFVCSADITGGNSGSPVVNRGGELVGVIFDSNRQGVADNFAYTDQQSRAVAVDSRAILQSLAKIYHADALLAELRGR